MKKLLMPIGCCLLMFTAATAQEKPVVEAKNKVHQKHEKIAKDAKELNLTKEQQEKVKSINQDYKAKTKDLKSNDNITRGEFKKEMKSLNEQKQTQVKSTLNAEQQKKLDELKAKRKNHKKATKKK